MKDRTKPSSITMNKEIPLSPGDVERLRSMPTPGTFLKEKGFTVTETKDGTDRVESWRKPAGHVVTVRYNG